MSANAAQALFERLVARALTAADPVDAFARASRARGLTPELKTCLASVQAGGVRLTALLVARLRFERLLRGSAAVERWYESDPRDFTEAFRAYHHAVPPRAFRPDAEARAFRGWLRRNSRGPAELRVTASRGGRAGRAR